MQDKILRMHNEVPWNLSENRVKLTTHGTGDGHGRGGTGTHSSTAVDEATANMRSSKNAIDNLNLRVGSDER